MKAFLTEWLLRWGTGWLEGEPPHRDFAWEKEHMDDWKMAMSCGYVEANKKRPEDSWRVTTKALKFIGEQNDDTNKE